MWQSHLQKRTSAERTLSWFQNATHIYGFKGIRLVIFDEEEDKD